MRFKKSLLKIERFFVYINLFFALLLLFSYLASVISPQKFWPLAFFGLTYSLLLFINLFFCIYWVIRVKKYFFISAISIVLGWNVLLNNIEFNISPKTSNIPLTARLKLMTYNVHNFNNANNGSPAYQQIVDVINVNQPDIIGFEEFYTQYSRFKICNSIKNVLHTSQFYFEPFKITPYDSTGLALFSKYPIIHKGILRLSAEKNDNQGIFIDVKYNSRVLRIYCFHLKSLELNALDYYYLNNFSHKGIVSLSGLRQVLSKVRQSFIVRAQQADLIHQSVAKCPYPYIFLGDFNDTPASYAFNQMQTGMKNVFREKGSGMGKTFNGGFASFQIDYILVSKELSVFDYQIIHKEISDHYPVCSNVVLN